MSWKECKEHTDGPALGFWNATDKTINIVLANLTKGKKVKGEGLLEILVHEMIHVLLDPKPCPPSDLRHLKNGTIKTVHGVKFSAEARHINKIAGFQLLNQRDCNWGLPLDHPDRLHNVCGKWVEYDEWKQHRKERRERHKELQDERREKLEHLAATVNVTFAEMGVGSDIRCEVPRGYHTVLTRALTERGREWMVKYKKWIGHERGHDGGYGDVRALTAAEIEGAYRAREEEAAQAVQEAKQRREAKAAAFASRLGKLTDEQRIASLRKQLANPRTPRQFNPNIAARLAALTGESQ